MKKADLAAKIPEEMNIRLTKAAEEAMCSKSAIIRRALDFYLAKNFKLLKSAG
jgi:hypothetical protein